MTIPTDPKAEPTTGNRARVKRYRLKHRRVDYAPSREALAVIEL